MSKCGINVTQTLKPTLHFGDAGGGQICPGAATNCHRTRFCHQDYILVMLVAAKCPGGSWWQWGTFELPRRIIVADQEVIEAVAVMAAYSSEVVVLKKKKEKRAIYAVAVAIGKMLPSLPPGPPTASRSGTSGVNGPGSAASARALSPVTTRGPRVGAPADVARILNSAIHRVTGGIDTTRYASKTDGPLISSTGRLRARQPRSAAGLLWKVTRPSPRRRADASRPNIVRFRTRISLST